MTAIKDFFEKYLMLIIGLIVGLLVGCAAGYIYRWAGDSGREAKAEVKQIKADVQKQNQAVQTLEVKREERKATNRVVAENYRRAVADPVYRSYCLSDDGLRVANQALSGVAKPDAALPKADAARR